MRRQTMSLDLPKHERIKYELRLVGSSITRVANFLGVRQNTVTLVCQGHRRSRRIEEAIAETLSIDVADLWPERYPSNEEGR